MTTATAPMYDATGANISHLPAGQAAGYVTGDDGVPWTAADWAEHPGAVRIDQSPVNTPADETADVADYENGAVTLADLPALVRAMQANFKAGTRPGQREPTVYASASSITPVVNELTAAGITSGVNLAVADYDGNVARATASVANASGPFPVVWEQYEDNGTYDSGIVSAAWLANVSKASQPPLQAITQDGWRWCHKCEGLFYGPRQALSVCPAGGAHDGSLSGNYSLNDMPA
jgi:hypothetical protein